MSYPTTVIDLSSEEVGSKSVGQRHVEDLDGVLLEAVRLPPRSSSSPPKAARCAPTDTERHRPLLRDRVARTATQAAQSKFADDAVRTTGRREREMAPASARSPPCERVDVVLCLLHQVAGARRTTQRAAARSKHSSGEESRTGE
jgi:hypothetical protein